MNQVTYAYSRFDKVIHAGLAIFGMTAFLTGEWAEEGEATLGYLMHSYLGLVLLAFMLLRVANGIVGNQAMQFSTWSPFSKTQWRSAAEDIGQLLRLKMPERGIHEGLAGLTHVAGLLLFGWMAVTGAGLFVLGGGESDIFGWIEEAHEIGEALIPLFLLLHVGSVLVHSMTGDSNWKKMWSFSRKQDSQSRT